MTSVAHNISVFAACLACHRNLDQQICSMKNSFAHARGYQLSICYFSSSKRGLSAITYAPNNEGSLLKEDVNIFDVMNSSTEADEGILVKTEERNNDVEAPFLWIDLLRKPLWILGPALLVITGMIPTLWLPVSSFYLGPSIASLLCLIGLDCIFNLGASLFLLMADSASRSSDKNQLSKSRPPSGYQFWNMTANIIGFITPVAFLFASEKGLLQPQLPFIAFSVMLVPYLLLLSVQIITESLTWHWESPVWLVTPVVYEAYRLVQLTRGLKLGLELGAPLWSMHAIRGLVCGWVLVLGVQLMRVAWYAGLTAYAFRLKPRSGGSDA